MSANNIGQSDLLKSYLKKQNYTAAQNSAAQDFAPAAVKAQPINQSQAPYAVQPDTLEISKSEIQNPNPTDQKPAKKKISKKMIFAGIGAAIIIAGIIIFAVCSRKKPEISPELETTLQDLVDTANDFFAFQ